MPQAFHASGMARSQERRYEVARSVWNNRKQGTTAQHLSRKGLCFVLKCAYVVPRVLFIRR